MNTVSTIVKGVLLIALTLVVGTVHGNLISRWGARPDVKEGGQLLEQCPREFGDWKLAKEEELDKKVKQILQAEGHVSRIYEHSKTGEQIRVFVVLGPAGPVAVHTPEVCYSSREFQIVRDRKKISIPSSDGVADEVWDLRMKANDVSATGLRVMYAWSNSTRWQAIEQPRFTFGGNRYLYKIQLSGPPPMEDGSRDACGDFLRDFLPVLRSKMLKS